MQQVEITSIAIVAGISLIIFFINLAQSKLIGEFKATLNDYRKALTNERSFNIRVLRYCLVRIMDDAVRNEDFETAKKCYDYILQMEDLEPKK
ncbi:MAG TPA: hypothetical protein PKC39_08275 [Ferruginibacter sp.]|nr:hypothetical protein [Ferruginibacter sp.]HMP20938.1 hypothetical protein [Ferruginibacter sp.]